MPGSYPNHFISIPRSVVSLKHYFQVHDQPFTRSLLYLVILGVLITLLGVAIGLGGYAREAPRVEAERMRELTEQLAAVQFEAGKAQAEGEQPRRLWKGEGMLVVLDTTGKTDTIEKAAEFAGCAVSRRLLLFGPQAIESVTHAAKEGERDQSESYPYSDVAKLAELRQLVEANGGKWPEFKLEENTARFDLEQGKVHVLVHNAELMALVPTTEKPLGPAQARMRAERENPDMRPPEFLVLVSESGAALKAIYEREPRAWAFADQEDLTAGALAAWIASAARQAQVAALKQGLVPNVVQMLLFFCVEIFFLALVSSVAGLIVNGVLRGSLAYGELLTMAVYATTPARLVLPFLVALSGLSGGWLQAAPYAVGLVYTALATSYTARSVGAEPAPKL